MKHPTPVKNSGMMYILYLFFVSISFSLFAQTEPLHGTYSIGSGANYDSIHHAIDALVENGIDGPVVFDIEDGIYSEQLTIPEIEGASEINTITFQSGSGVNTDVIISWSAEYTIVGEGGVQTSDNWIVLLEGANYLTFANLTFKSENPDIGNVIVFQNQTSHIRFTNNIIEGSSTPIYDSYNNTLVRNDYYLNDNCLFENNIFRYGRIAIDFSSADQEEIASKLVIINNDFIDQVEGFIYLYNSDSVSILNNVISTSASDYYYYYGILLNNSQYTKVIGNNIYLSSGYGLYLYNLSDGLIANNMISTGGSDNAYGIYMESCIDMSLIYNSILNYSSYYYSACLYLGYNSGTNELINNNFANYSEGAAFINASYYYENTLSDYNNYYSTTNLVLIPGGEGYTSIDDLDELREYTQADTHSISTEPLFFSNTNLHTSNVYLNGRALPVAEITQDFDGETRNNLTPDIGADEFDPQAVDAGITRLMDIPPQTGPVTILLTNFGLEDITKVTINWTLDGIIQSAYEWSGLLESEDTINIVIGNADFVPASSYSFKIWCSDPNNTADGNHYNDTLSIDVSTPMTGIYTIGGTDPDFESFAEVINDLNEFGVYDSVLFNIRSGIYNELISIPHIEGADEPNSIIFQSESQDSTDVALTHNSSNYYGIYLDYADGITFRYMTLSAENTSYSRLVVINGGKNICFNNVHFKGISTSSTSTYHALLEIYTTGNLEIYNTIFEKGSYGIYFYSSDYSPKDSCIIENNLFDNQYYNGIYSSSIDNIIIINNVIRSSSAYSSFTACSLRYCDNFFIEKNRISVATGTGLEISYYNNSANKFRIIANNFLHLGSGSSSALRLIGINDVKVYYNSIHVQSSSTSSSCIYVYGCTNTRINNNILAHSGSGIAFYLPDYSSIQICDYNNLYSTGSNIGYYYNSYVTDLSAWKNVTGYDSHSVSTNPGFFSNSDLHALSGAVNKAGISITGIDTDIDNEIRDPNNPDIGADEFVGMAFDAGIIEILPVPGGLHEIPVVLKNFGNDTLRSAQIGWIFNDTLQISVQWNGVLTTGDTVLIKLPSKNFYSLVPYSIECWSASPNGTTDLDHSNDTARVTSKYPALQGIYTIGGTDPDFTGFYYAVNALKQYGVAGQVIFDVRNGTYSDRISLPAISGAGTKNSIIFRSETGDSTAVILNVSSSSSYPYVVQLDKAAGITFERMTFASLGSSYGRVFNLINDCRDIAIQNNIIRTETQSTYNSELIYGSGNTNTGINISRNVLIKGTYAVYFNSNSLMTNTLIEGNRCIDQSVESIYLRNLYGPVLSGNIIDLHITSTNGCGIHLESCYGNIKIEKNKISIFNGGRAVMLGSCTASSNAYFSISNNFLYAGGTSTSYGIYAINSQYFDVLNNNVHLVNSGNQSGGIVLTSCMYSKVMNNISLITGTGYAISLNGSSYYSNFNDFLSEEGNFGYWNGDQKDLAAWQANANWDSNSVSLDPMYFSNTDLHIREIELNGAGVLISPVTDDIDGELRDPVHPDIGADEIIVPESDAGITKLTGLETPLSEGLHPVVIILRNFGSTTLTKAIIHWKFNGLMQDSINWTGSLISGDTISVLLGTRDFARLVKNNIKVWPSHPNGQDDVIAVNDTLSVDNMYAAFDGVYTIGGTSPDFENFRKAIEILTIAGVSGPVQIYVRPGTYNEQVILPAITGVNNENTIVFEGESSNANDVILTSSASSSNNYTLLLDGASFVTFRKISFRSANSSYPCILKFRKTCRKIIFADDIIFGASDNDHIINIASSCDSILFENNRLTNGSYAIFSNQNTRGLLIRNNEFDSQGNGAVIISYAVSPEISNNTIRSTSGNSYGILLQYCDSSILVFKNRIFLKNGGRGIYINSCGETNDVPKAWISNNFIWVAGNASNYGIYDGYNTQIQYICNSVNISNGNLSSYAFYSYSAGNSNVLNNILCNKGAGYALYFYNQNAGTRSDHNDLITNGTYLGQWSSTNCQNLTSWIQTSHADSNSVSIDPLFVSDSNLHVREITLDEAGIPVPYVSDDIDNETRDSVIPDIGADEFIPAIAYDAGIFSIASPVKPFPAGDNDVHAVVRNYGTSPLTSVTIHWKVNDIVQPSFNWSGSIASGSTDTVNIGTFHFETAEPYKICVYTTDPNHTTDLLNINDSVTINNIYAALGGEYTLGTQGSTFPYFADLEKTLFYGGVCDNSTIRIADGYYNEKITFNKITGAGPDHRIFFESASGNKSGVIISVVGTSAANYIFNLNGADFITFRNITLRNTGSDYSTMIRITGNSENNCFDNIKFDGNVLNSTGSSNALVYLDQTGKNLFVNNEFLNGSYGIYSSGCKQVTYSNNITTNQYAAGLYVNSSDSILISGNRFLSSSNYSSYIAVAVQNVDSFVRIEKNRIYIINSGYGINLNNCNNNQKDKIVVANNFISLAGTSSVNGIYLTYNNSISVVHNSINSINTNSSTRVIYVYNNYRKIHLYNNIFKNTVNNCIYDISSDTVASDYNDFNSTNTNCIRYKNNLYTLQNWQTTTSNDLHSLSIDPLFVSDTNLHVKETGLNGTGTRIFFVEDDIDSESRDTIAPDMGADEFSLSTFVDAGVSAYVAPKQPFPKGENDITVVIKNYSQNAISSLSIGWTINGANQTPFVWSGTLEPVSGVDTVVIGSFNFEDLIKYKLIAWTYNPNSTSDSLTYNDTLIADNIYAALSGDYTIGSGSGSDFHSFNQAVNVLSLAGIMGNTVFNIANGTYSESFILNEIQGADSNHTVTFQSASGNSASVNLTYTGTSLNNYVIKLDGADYITLRNLNILNNSSDYGKVIVLMNGANHNIIENNIIRSVCDYYDALIYSENSSDNYNSISGNLFDRGKIGIYFRGSSELYETGTVIRNNTFNNLTYQGIYLQYEDSPVISMNTVNGTNSSSFLSVYLNYCRNNTLIEKNKIFCNYGGTGIYLDNCQGQENSRILVANNFISIQVSKTSRAFYLAACKYVDIYNNSSCLYMNNSYTKVSLTDYSGQNIRILNNIFANTSGGQVYYFSNTTSLISDHNDLYCTGSELAYKNGQVFTSVENWKSVTGLDVNSLHINPQYISSSDLHIRELALMNAATPVAEITEDIDGDLRYDIAPDIGADEINLPSNDAGITTLVSPVVPFASGTNDLKAGITNFGAGILTSATINYSVNNASPIAYSWTGSLNTGDADTVTLGQYSFTDGNKYQILISSSNPNGNADQNSSNDSLLITNLYVALEGEYTIGKQPDADFNSFKSATIRLNNAGVSGPVTFNIIDGMYTENIVLQSVRGVNASSPILFQSMYGDSTAVLLVDSLNGPTLTLYGASYLTFKGIDIRNSNQATGNYNPAMKIINNSNHINFAGNILEIQYLNGNPFDQPVVDIDNSQNNNLVFTNNRFIEGSYGINSYQTAEFQSEGLIIRDNIFEDQNINGINISYKDAPVIEHNIIQSLSTSFTGIAIGYCSNGMNVSKNHIIAKERYGMNISNCSGSLQKPSLITNNFISVTGIDYCYGMKLSGNSYLRLYNNSINVQSVNNYSYGIYYSNGENNQSLNNIVCNYGNGYALYFQDISGFTISNYNDIYCRDGSLAFLATDIADLNSWRSTSGFDGASYSYDPFFASQTDLHASQSFINNKGLVLSEITTDIDNEPRNTSTPDIGADEFSPVANDIGISRIPTGSGCQMTSNETIRILIDNFGSAAQANFTVGYILNNKDTVIENSGSLIVEPGQSKAFAFVKGGDLSRLGNHLIKAWVALDGDNNHSNDSTLTYIYNTPAFNAEADEYVSACFGQATYASVNGGEKYLWNTGSTNSWITFTPYVDTAYTVIITNSYGCIDYDTIHVTVFPVPEKPVITADGPTTFCNGSSVTLTTNYDHGIWWSNYATSQTVKLEQSWDCYVIYTDSSGCYAISDIINIIEEDKPSLTTNKYTTICQGDAIKLTINKAATYTWSTGQVTSSITVSPSSNTTYYVNGTTALGCPYHEEVSISVIPGTLTPGMVSDLIPADGSADMDLPVALSWLPTTNVAFYEVTMWPEKDGVMLPVKTFTSDGIHLDLDEGQLEYGTTYTWQVAAENGCKSTPGIKQMFSVRHLPDLVINSMQVPVSAFSDQEIELTWEVKNIGRGNTINKNWVDRAYLSSDSTLGVDLFIGQSPSVSYLEPGQSYFNSVTGIVPHNNVGDYYAIAHTDAFRKLKETNDDNNADNSHDLIWIKLNPPPDLQVTSITAPLNMVSEQKYTVSWTVQNKGQNKTTGSHWNDKVMLSKDISASRTYDLGYFSHNDTLEVGEEYTATMDITLPVGIYGTYYIYVHTDVSNQIKEHAYDDNNISQSDPIQVILFPPADLTAINIQYPDTVNNVDPFRIQWTTINEGAAASVKAAPGWYDKVLLTPTQDTNLKNSQQYLYEWKKRGIETGFEGEAFEDITLPEYIAPGDYFVHINVNYSENTYEYNRTNNLVKGTKIMHVNRLDWADLRIKELNAPDTAAVEDTIPVSYRIQNQGIAKTRVGSWIDRFYLSRDTILDGTDVRLSEVPVNQALEKDSSLLINIASVVPGKLYDGGGNYYLLGYTDASDAVYEFNKDSNNFFSRRIYIEPGDMSIQEIDMPDSILAGTRLDIGWTIQNIDSAPVPAPYWIDRVYYEGKMIFDSEIFRILRSQDIYSGSVAYGVPVSDSGWHYLYFSCDELNYNHETLRKNNTRIDSVYVMPVLPSDLVVSSITIPEQAWAGQPIPLQWTVTNQGENTTSSAAWIDGVYLSNDFEYDYYPYLDLKLVETTRQSVLQPGNSYNVSTQGTIPVDKVGNYIVIFHTDRPSFNFPEGMVFEGEHEKNNMTFFNLKVLQPPPSDLIVTSITCPVKAITGDNMTISWSIKNLGPNPAKGYMKDMIYLSRDTLWDLEDVLFAEDYKHIDLQPGESASYTITEQLESTSIGDYYILVKTDNHNNIFESNDDNNALVSDNVLNIDVKELKLDSLTPDTLHNYRELYYRIEIPDSLNDETILITLEGDTLTGKNEMYVKYQDVPTRSNYDIGFEFPFSGNQELVIPSVTSGTWYLLVYGTVENKTLQNISLYARKLNFEFRRINANKGGNNGKITVMIEGAKFDSLMTVSLVNDHDSIPAEQIYFVHAAKVFVTFDLKNKPLGLYDVWGRNSKDKTTLLPEGFEIIEGSKPNLLVFPVYPGRVRIGTKIAIVIQYANAGNTDLNDVTIFMKSLSTTPIALTVDDLNKWETRLNLLCNEPHGPGTTLRPGAVGQITVYSVAYHGLSFIIEEPKFE